MTSRELKALEDLANGGGSPESPQVDEEQARLALRTAEQLDESVRHCEQTLVALGELLDGCPLPKALIGALGISVTELRSQMPALREAVREVGK